MDGDLNDVNNINTSDVGPKDEQDKKCAPGIKFEAGSCIKLHILIEMANAYNIKYPESKIKLHPNLETLNPHKYKKYLLSQFNKQLKSCESQKCWIEQDFINKMRSEVAEELEKFTFRPDGPAGKFEWLNTLHIAETVEQYEKLNPDFKFLGAVPMDFDDLERLGIKNLNFKENLDNGITKYGVVFNLDDHDEPGSHWVALFSDLKKGEIVYFDSYGLQPEKRVRSLMRRMSKFCQTGMGLKHIKVDYNKIRHQYKNSECGVYSINFIVRMLRGDSFEEIVQSKVPDETVNKCRKKYFIIPEK